MRRLLLFALFVSSIATGQQLAPELTPFLKIDAPVVALTHVKVIDGTGRPAMLDQTVVISAGKIEAVGPSVLIPQGAKVLDLKGYSLIPGLVGMHDHLFYPLPSDRDAQGKRRPGSMALYGTMAYSFPRLYLANGVTTIRTTGSLETYTDLQVKKMIDSGKAIGPHMNVTGPYLEGPGAYTPQMYQLKDADDARETVNYWADRGVGSFKAYMNITRAELAAAVEAAHKRGIKVTGHLCSIGFREAAAIGIDDLEHGLVVDTEFDPGKKPDVCEGSKTEEVISALDLTSGPGQEMIRDLVQRHVAVTSTLPVFEQFVPSRPNVPDRVLEVLAPEFRADYLATRTRRAKSKDFDGAWTKELEFERAFVRAGGTLLAGLDPTGMGGTIAGFGDLREVELLVDAKLTPLEAIHIATQNGAEFLGMGDKIGTIAKGKQADLVVIKGDPDTRISDIENVEIVFKDGLGYDPAKIIDSVKGTVGLH